MRAVALVVISFLAHADDTVLIKDPAGWSSAVPAGFTEVEQPSIYLRTFKRGDLVIGFQELKYPSALDLDGDCLAESAKGSGMTIIREAWEGLTLCGFRSEQQRGGRAVVTLTVQLPMLPNAMNLMVAAPGADEKTARALLKQVLAATRGRHQGDGPAR